MEGGFFGIEQRLWRRNLTWGASQMIMLDVHLNPSVSYQAIGRAFRPGQERKVYPYRLVAAKSLEEDHLIKLCLYIYNKLGHKGAMVKFSAHHL